MSKKIFVSLAAVMFLAAAAAEASAQDVVMNSAETINPGNVKLAFFPTVLFGKNGSDRLWGAAGRVGIGITSRFDVEAKAAIFKGLKYLGADAELWFIHGKNFNGSAALGVHMTNLQPGEDSRGFDTTLLFSHRPVQRLEIYGGFKFAYDWVNNSDRRLAMMHLVPGLEFRVTDDIDFLAEFGIGLNDNARHYASVGLALYLFR
ncbi:MAG: hypothetical protein PHI34_04270 [Acidobacteriota bacterium]|nr:hypothetical protein [Acidobacteriota bacterium]